MTIAHFDIPIWQQEYLSSNLSSEANDTHLFFEQVQIDQETIEKIKDAEILTIFIHTQFTKEILDKLPNLKLIVTRSTGYDHIDLVACQSRNAVVCNVPTYGTQTIAEHVFGLLLNISHNLNTLINRTRQSNFEYRDSLGFDLAGKTLGLIGAGKIGQSVASLAKAFGMKVVAFDIYQNTEKAQEIGYEYVTKDELLSRSDVISLHCLLSDQTKDILGKDNFAKIKPGSVIINTARGDLVENSDLLLGLETGIFKAVGADTIQNESKIKNGSIDEIQKKLLAHPGFFFTPHSAYYTREAMQRILDTTCQNILAFEKGEIINQVKN